MKRALNDRTKLTVPDYRSSSLKRNASEDRSPAPVDTDTQAHLGRTMRQVYETDLSSSLPPEMLALLRQLDAVPSGSSDSRGG